MDAFVSSNLSKLEDVISNPFYLHPIKDPSLQLTSTVLTGNNFHFWSRSMRMALISKNMLRFVGGSLFVTNRDDPLYKTYERCGTLVLY